MNKIETISIPVTDQEKAREFYVGKLGFKVIFENATPQGKWLQLAIPNDNTSISLVSGAMHAPAGSMKGTIISTNNVEDDVQHLRKKGVNADDVQQFPYGKISSFSDPDGNQWVLREVTNG